MCNCVQKPTEASILKMQVLTPTLTPIAPPAPNPIKHKTKFQFSFVPISVVSCTFVMFRARVT